MGSVNIIEESMMKTDKPEILRQFWDILCEKHKRFVRWKGRRLDEELVSRGFNRTHTGGWRKYLDGSSIGKETLSVHVVIPHGGDRGVYHLDEH